MRKPLLIFALFALLQTAQASAACMKPEAEESAQGRLTVGNFKDAAGRSETAFILRLSASVCLDGGDAEQRVKGTRAIHVYASDGKVQAALWQRVGKVVQVRGNPFARHTAHHHAPIVMEVRAADIR